MAGTLLFDRDYAEFGPRIRDFEKADPVGIVVTQFLWYDGSPFYPIGDLMEVPITAVWLGEDEAPSEEIIDLIFRMPSDSEEFPFFYEIVLRTDEGAVYGGWAFGDKLRITDEVVNGHRVLEAEDPSGALRFTYEPGSGEYRFTQTAFRATAMRARQIAKRRR